MLQENIGKFIAQERKNAGLTQEQFAEKLGVSNRSVSRWENGKTMPDFSLFPMICETFEISTTELLNGKRSVQADLKENIGLLIGFFGEENRKKLQKVNRCYLLGFLCLGLSVLHIGFGIFAFAKWPKVLTIFLLILAGLFGMAGFSYSRQKISYTESEIAAFLGVKTDCKLSTAGEMLQFAKRNQKIDFKQYEKAFQAIEKELEAEETVIFSMAAETLVVNEEWSDGWKPWHIALAVSNQRMLVSGETVRGRFMTSYDVESYEMKEFLTAEAAERNVTVKFKNRTLKLGGKDLEKAGMQLKAVLEQKF